MSIVCALLDDPYVCVREDTGYNVSPKPECISDDEQFSLCCLCGMSFPTIRSLHTHIKVSHEDVADEFDLPSDIGSPSVDENIALSSPMDSQTISDEGSIKAEETLRCSHCLQRFSNPKSLRVHKYRAHTGATRSRCDVCDKVFSTVSYLRVHISTVHEGVKPYVCPVCGKSYTQKHSMKKHMNTVHPGVDDVDDNGPYGNETTSGTKSNANVMKNLRNLLNQPNPNI